MAKHPCINCVYFTVCGNTNRTEKCKGRQTKSQYKREINRIASDMLKSLKEEENNND